MPESADVSTPITAFSVPDRHFHHLEVEFRSSKDEVKVPEGIKVSEIAAVRLNPLVVLVEQRLGAAQGVFESLIEDPREHEREKPVPDQVEDSHRLFFHGINKTAPVDEFSDIISQCPVKLGKVYRGNRQIPVQDHQDVPFCEGKPASHCVALSPSLLDH